MGVRVFRISQNNIEAWVSSAEEVVQNAASHYNLLYRLRPLLKSSQDASESELKQMNNLLNINIECNTLLVDILNKVAMYIKLFVYKFKKRNISGKKTIKYSFFLIIL